MATAQRQLDGSLPRMGLAQLREDSDLIDRGEERGFAFAGAAPDLGAFESGLTPVDDADAGVPAIQRHRATRARMRVEWRHRLTVAMVAK